MYKWLTIIAVFFSFFNSNLWADRICVKTIDGERVYTNFCEEKIKKVSTKKLGRVQKISTSQSVSHSSRHELEKIVDEKSRFYGVDSKLIKEMIKEESGWNPNAVSPKGAMGIMQLMPQTAILMGVKDPFDPVQNIDGGIKYMKYLLDRFNGNFKLALAAYNAGPNLVESLGRIPKILETQNYVRKISLRYAGDSGQYRIKKMPIKAIILSDGSVVYTNREDLYIWSTGQ
ncbi:lytic transglycosylase domain-containing protein [Thermodesulfovibrio yellowstonii]|uniref:lytic transglycosylase domain-containing protein n=1 Tax=Thermodesulfovibrio yellowstonii TaxID=28262 RepID=UPI003C7CCCC6